MRITNRNQFPELLKHFGLLGAAVEVGCAEGYNAFNILDNWPGTLTMIDPYRILDTPGFSGHGEGDDAGQEARYQRMIRAAQKYGGRCKVMRATSEEAAPRFEDGSLQFVYLDGNHILDEVRKDLALWFPKLAVNSVFAGHDHLDGIKGGVDYGVKSAVAEFARKHGFSVNVTSEVDYPSWWIRLK